MHRFNEGVAASAAFCVSLSADSASWNSDTSPVLPPNLRQTEYLVQWPIQYKVLRNDGRKAARAASGE